MYTVVPGKSGALVARVEVSVMVAKPVQKPAPAPTPKLAPMAVEVMMHVPCTCSSKGVHGEFSHKGLRGDNWRYTGKEHRKCQHSHLGRRGRRVITIYQ